MNANELADKLEYLYQQDDADGIQMPVFLYSATMLRTIPALQAEIESLLKFINERGETGQLIIWKAQQK
jgi:putative protein kinase ArgK-like GTPase of G3E family